VEFSICTSTAEFETLDGGESHGMIRMLE